MPNTLIHFAIQTPLNRLAIKQTDLLWVLIGCIIPDLPWILQRVVKIVGGMSLNYFDLRLYVMIQASLGFCLLLSLAISILTKRPVRVFLILGINCFIHLILDSLQIKWGNGVHLLGPVNWDMLHIGFVWPEHMVTQIITIVGIPVVLYNWRGIAREGLQLAGKSIARITVTTLLALMYFACPFLFFNQLEATDSYYIQTMKNVDERAGKTVEFDRAIYDVTTQTAKHFSNETFIMKGALPSKSGKVSIQGHFASPDTIISTKYHLHKDHRDYASIIGLFMACALVAHSLILSIRRSSGSCDTT